MFSVAYYLKEGVLNVKQVVIIGNDIIHHISRMRIIKRKKKVIFLLSFQVLRVNRLI
jgi:hypothetical protein